MGGSASRRAATCVKPEEASNGKSRGPTGLNNRRDVPSVQCVGDIARREPIGIPLEDLTHPLRLLLVLFSSGRYDARSSILVLLGWQRNNEGERILFTA